MSEPRLEDMDDYNTLKDEKKKVVWAVVFAGLLMGIIYAFVYSSNEADDAIKVNEAIKIIPVK